MKKFLLFNLMAFADFSLAGGGDECCAEVGLSFNGWDKIKYGKNPKSKLCKAVMSTKLMQDFKYADIQDEEIDLPFFKIYAEKIGDNISVWIKRNEDLLDNEKLERLFAKLQRTDISAQSFKEQFIEPLAALENKMSLAQFDDIAEDILDQIEFAPDVEKRATVIYLMIAFGDFDKYYTTNGKFDPDISKMTKTPNPIEILGEKCAKYAVVSDDEIEITINKGNYFYKEFIEMDEPFMKANENFTLKKSDEMSDIWVFSPKK